MDLNVYQVNAFTTEQFKGNPAGVVSNANQLTDFQMQQIARELNNSETAFIIENTPQTQNTEVRFFTPTCEVPICGHATISAHYVRALENNSITQTITQKTKAGELEIDIVKEDNDYTIVMTQAKPYIKDIDKIVHKNILEALNLQEKDINIKAPISEVSTGHSKVIVCINDEKTLHSIKPNLEKLKIISKDIGINGFFVFTIVKNKKYLTNGRMFAPIIGIDEDPVTGNANGPLGAYLVYHKLISVKKNTIFSFIAKQGEAINREGFIKVIVYVNNNLIPEKIKIEGQAIIIFKTTINIL